MSDQTKGGSTGGPQPDRPPNDKRSDVKNPNNPDYDADQLNRQKQGGTTS